MTDILQMVCIGLLCMEQSSFIHLINIPSIQIQAGPEGIDHECCDGHGSNSFWHRGNITAFGSNFLKIDVSPECETTFLGRVWHARNTDVYDNYPLLNH